MCVRGKGRWMSIAGKRKIKSAGNSLKFHAEMMGRSRQGPDLRAVQRMGGYIRESEEVFTAKTPSAPSQIEDRLVFVRIRN